MQHGIAFVTEDRKVTGLNLDDSVRGNIAMASLPEMSPNYVMRRREEQAASTRMISHFGIKTARDTMPVSSLSGGNQQKVVLGKWFLRNPKILLLDEPTRGVDVGAKREIYRIICDFAASRRHGDHDFIGDRRGLGHVGSHTRDARRSISRHLRRAVRPTPKRLSIYRRNASPEAAPPEARYVKR
jgi:hypothetical protein